MTSKNHISARDASILSLIARAQSKKAARKFLKNMMLGMAPTPIQAALFILGDVKKVSTRARALAETAMRWSKYHASTSHES